MSILPMEYIIELLENVHSIHIQLNEGEYELTVKPTVHEEGMTFYDMSLENLLIDASDRFNAQFIEEEEIY